MSPADPASARVSPLDVEAWLSEFGIEPTERSERDGVTSWDLKLDGRRRFDIRVTLILDPSLALVIWTHFAPPISDSFRRSYRKLLRWNDEFPFLKFSIAEDERPILAVEIPIERVERDEVGLGLARVLATCDRLAGESAAWIWPDGKVPDAAGRASRQGPLFTRYAERLSELTGP